jgi:ribonuclease III
MADLAEFEQKLGFRFHNQTYLEVAFIHSSYINENPGLELDCNERLEFVGDSILGLVIAEKLYHDFPDSPEGELTRLRAALVRRETLANLARKINLGNYLSMGNGEAAGGGRDKAANLAGAFESLIAAIYLDQGLESARSFILGLFGPEIYQQAHRRAGTDYKSKLQEILQAQQQIAPSYTLIQAVGPEHDRQFTVEVWAGAQSLGRGTGKSKKLAEMEAARAALEKFPVTR